jgi:hypothetical protein
MNWNPVSQAKNYNPLSHKELQKIVGIRLNSYPKVLYLPMQILWDFRFNPGCMGWPRFCLSKIVASPLVPHGLPMF